MLTIGSTVWVFDDTRRVYKNGVSGPIYREYFVERTIAGETSRSWLIGRMKFDKKTYLSASDYRGIKTRMYPSIEAVNDAVYMREQRGHIADLVMRCKVS